MVSDLRVILQKLDLVRSLQALVVVGSAGIQSYQDSLTKTFVACTHARLSLPWTRSHISSTRLILLQLLTWGVRVCTRDIVMDSQLDIVLSPQALLVARSAALVSENDRLTKTLRGDKIDKSAGESQLKTVQARSDAVEQALRGQMATMEVCLQHVHVQWEVN